MSVDVTRPTTSTFTNVMDDINPSILTPSIPLAVFAANPAADPADHQWAIKSPTTASLDFNPTAPLARDLSAEELRQWQAEERRRFDSMEAQKHAFYLEEVTRRAAQRCRLVGGGFPSDKENTPPFGGPFPRQPAPSLSQGLGNFEDKLTPVEKPNETLYHNLVEEEDYLAVRTARQYEESELLAKGPVLPPQHRPCSTQCSHCACTVAKDNWAGYVDSLSPYLQSMLKNPLQFNAKDQAYVRLIVPLISKHEGVQNMMSTELNRRATCRLPKCQWGSTGKMNKFLKRSGLRDYVRTRYPDASKTSRKAKCQRLRPY